MDLGIDFLLFVFDLALTVLLDSDLLFHLHVLRFTLFAEIVALEPGSICLLLNKQLLLGQFTKLLLGNAKIGQLDILIGLVLEESSVQAGQVFISLVQNALEILQITLVLTHFRFCRIKLSSGVLHLDIGVLQLIFLLDLSVVKLFILLGDLVLLLLQSMSLVVEL